VRGDATDSFTLTPALSLKGRGGKSPLPKGERVRVRGDATDSFTLTPALSLKGRGRKSPLPREEEGEAQKSTNPILKLQLNPALIGG